MMSFRNVQGKKMMWRWWCGGGVIAFAVVLGCASAVQFNEADRELGAKRDEAPVRLKRGVASEPGHELPHNGGKVKMPVTATIAGDGTLSIARDPSSQIVVVISIAAGDAISSIQGSIQGRDGLRGVDQPLGFSQLASGQTASVQVTVPARTGSLIVGLAGDVGGQMMSTAIDLKIINSKDLSVSAKMSGASAKSLDMQAPPSVDATGQIVQPMSADDSSN